MRNKLLLSIIFLIVVFVLGILAGDPLYHATPLDKREAISAVHILHSSPNGYIQLFPLPKILSKSNMLDRSWYHRGICPEYYRYFWVFERTIFANYNYRTSSGQKELNRLEKPPWISGIISPNRQ